MRRTFGNNPDVSKALRVLAEQGEGGHWGRAVLWRPCGDACAATLGQAGEGCAPVWTLGKGRLAALSTEGPSLPANPCWFCYLTTHPRLPGPAASPAGKVVRKGEGGRGTPFSWSATAKGRNSVAEARAKLEADEQLLRNSSWAGAGVDGAGGQSPQAEDREPADQAQGQQQQQQRQQQGQAPQDAAATAAAVQQ